ncbi:GTPase-activating protein [Nowakowskiella sp. JEL0407]|nr:GTPase-activating protein [Nowakowskiella sp. JEL0407]
MFGGFTLDSKSVREESPAQLSNISSTQIAELPSGSLASLSEKESYNLTHRKSVKPRRPWTLHAVSLPGRITIEILESENNLSHFGIGLATGILGARVSNPNNDTVNKSKNTPQSRSFRRFEKFLADTAGDWDEITDAERLSPSNSSNKLYSSQSNADIETEKKSEIVNEKSPEDIENMPKKSFEAIHASNSNPTPVSHKKPDEEAKMMGEIAKLNTMSIRYTKFKALLELPMIDLDNLKKSSWSGIPEEIRGTVWKLLMGYLPLNSDRREATLQRKRKEYEEFVAQSFGRGKAALDEALLHQIHIDVKRTNANIPLYQNLVIREALERILYCWAIRHPASGYVQGINDLVVPFFHVFLSSGVTGNIETCDVEKISKDMLSNVEADCFWCLTKLLDGIQDNYTFAQPGIQRQIGRLKELTNRIDAPLYAHLTAQGVDFIQFAFRWMNCLLMREISLKNMIRLWDTYQAENDGFSDFHLYVCAAFLVKWSDKLKKMEFQDIMMFLQSLPTSGWEEKDIEMLLAEAFMLKELFHNSPSHLSGTNPSATSPS